MKNEVQTAKFSIWRSALPPLFPIACALVFLYPFRPEELSVMGWLYEPGAALIRYLLIALASLMFIYLFMYFIIAIIRPVSVWYDDRNITWYAPLKTSLPLSEIDKVDFGPGQRTIIIKNKNSKTYRIWSLILKKQSSGPNIVSFLKLHLGSTSF